MAYRDVVVLADNPVSYWRLGEALGTDLPQDELAANHAASVVGGTAVDGLLVADLNRARSFDGVDDRVLMPAASTTLQFTSTFTLEAWVKPTGTAKQMLLHKGSTVDAYGLALLANGTFEAFIQDTVPGFRIVRGGSWSPGDLKHVVATKSATEVSLYVDGTLVGATAAVADARVSSDALSLGVQKSAEFFTQGVLDEVAVYSTALSAERVGAHYTAGITSPSITITYTPARMRKVA